MRHASSNLFSILAEVHAAARLRGCIDHYASITTHGGDAKVHGRVLPVAPIELAELLGASQADLETLDLAEPAFRLGFGDSGDQVVADLGKPSPLGRVRSEERAPDTGLSELAQLAARWHGSPSRC